MNKKITTKEIVEASLISALIFIIAIISVYIPFLTAIGLFILPIPVTVLYIKYGFRTSLLSVVTSFLLIAILYDPIKAIIATISYGIVGIVFGFCIKREVRVFITNLLLTVSNIIVNIISFIVYTAFIYKTTFIEQIQQFVNINKESVKTTREFYESFTTLNSEQLQVLEQLENAISVQMILTVIPAALILAAIVQSVINYNITRSILKKIKIKEIDKIKPIDQLYISNLITAGLLIIWSLGVLIDYLNISIGSYISSTIMYLMMYVFVFNGISTLVYYLRNKIKIKVGKWLIVLIFIMSYTTPLFLNTLFFVGIIDSIIDLRKLDPYSFRNNKKGEKNE